MYFSLQQKIGATIEPVLNDHHINCTKYGLSREVVFGDRFHYVEV